MKILALLLLFATIFSSCTKNEYKFGGQIIDRHTREPIPGISIGLYKVHKDDNNSAQVYPLKMELYTIENKATTDSSGFYLFDLEDEPELWVFLQLLAKEGDFDSTSIDWHYFSQLDYFKGSLTQINWCNDCSVIEVVPGGVFHIQITNQAPNDSILVKAELTDRYAYNEVRWSRYPWYLRPHRNYNFDFYKVVNGEEQFIETQSLYVKNAIESASTSNNIIVEPYVLEVTLLNY